MAIQLFIEPCDIFDAAFRRSVSTLFCASENQKLRAVMAISGAQDPLDHFVPSQPCSERSMVTPSGPMNLTSTFPRFAISSVPG